MERLASDECQKFLLFLLWQTGHSSGKWACRVSGRNLSGSILPWWKISLPWTGQTSKSNDCQGFSSFLPKEHSHCYTSFILFSGDEQFGLLLCEVEQKDISFMQICSLQIGALLHFIQLNASERQIQKELQDSMKVSGAEQHLKLYLWIWRFKPAFEPPWIYGTGIHAMNQFRQKAYLFLVTWTLKGNQRLLSHLAGDFALRTVSERRYKPAKGCHYCKTGRWRICFLYFNRYTGFQGAAFKESESRERCF